MVIVRLHSKRKQTISSEDTSNLTQAQEPSPVSTRHSFEVHDQQETDLRAGPSAFATAIIRSPDDFLTARPEDRQSGHVALSLLPGMNITELSPFAGPSPDDVVQRAQTQKGE